MSSAPFTTYSMLHKMDEQCRQRFDRSGPPALGLHDNRGSESSNASSVSNHIPTSYTSDQLKKIGVQCAGRLPPASAVQAMFFYEMQRQTELEKLFQHQIFRLARADDEAAEKDRHIEQLEARIQRLEAKTVSHDLQARLATSETRMLALHGKLKEHEGRYMSMETSIIGIEERQNDMHEELLNTTQLAHETASKLSEIEPPPAKEDLTRLDADIEQVFGDVRTLWIDRNGTQLLLTDVENRLMAMEGKLRALTLPTIGAPSRTVSPDYISLNTTDPDKVVDLVVPVTGPLVSLRDDQRIREFSPGKQWAS